MKYNKSPLGFILVFYLICFAFRVLEYFVIRTDQSFIGEAFIHKLVGIGLLALALWAFKYKWSDIGFRANSAVKGTLFGLLFGLTVYFVAYGTEVILNMLQGNGISLEFYAASYAFEGSTAMQSGLLFVVICIVGNIINVIMEEGVFRGLFMKLAQPKYSFLKACLLSSLLFGVWHIIAPMRSAFDGGQSPMGAFMTALMLVLTSTLAGIQYVLLYKLTGTQWFGMAAHFVNNAIVNLLHVVSATGADEMQTVRIAIAQALSCILVLVVFIAKRKKVFEKV